jgi:hypothetical protein
MISKNLKGGLLITGCRMLTRSYEYLAADTKNHDPQMPPGFLNLTPSTLVKISPPATSRRTLLQLHDLCWHMFFDRAAGSQPSPRAVILEKLVKLVSSTPCGGRPRGCTNPPALGGLDLAGKGHYSLCFHSEVPRHITCEQYTGMRDPSTADPSRDKPFAL